MPMTPRSARRGNNPFSVSSVIANARAEVSTPRGLPSPRQNTNTNNNNNNNGGKSVGQGGYNSGGNSYGNGGGHGGNSYGYDAYGNGSADGSFAATFGAPDHAPGRASLQNPTRPVTPGDTRRALLTQDTYSDRPTSAFSVSQLGYVEEDDSAFPPDSQGTGGRRGNRDNGLGNGYDNGGYDNGYGNAGGGDGYGAAGEGGNDGHRPKIGGSRGGGRPAGRPGTARGRPRRPEPGTAPPQPPPGSRPSRNGGNKNNSNMNGGGGGGGGGIGGGWDEDEDETGVDDDVLAEYLEAHGRPSAPEPGAGGGGGGGGGARQVRVDPRGVPDGPSPGEGRLAKGGDKGGRGGADVGDGAAAGAEDPFAPMWELVCTTHLARIEDAGTPLESLRAEVDALWGVVREANFADRRHERNRLLRALFRLVDRHSDNALYMAICRISLHLATPGGQTLLNTCKLLFKMSKSQGNDDAFRSAGLLEPLIHLVEAPGNRVFEMLLYAVGTIKNVSAHEPNQRFLSQQGGIAILGGVLAWDGEVPSTEKRVQLLVQVTAALRNLAAVSGNRKQFVEFAVLPAVLAIIARHRTYGELMLNCVRIVSKLSLYEDCRKIIGEEADTTGAIFDLLTLHGRSAALVIRVCFILGNVTSRNEVHRLALAESHDAVNTLLGLLFDYSLVDESLHEEREKGGAGGAGGAADDAADAKPEVEGEVSSRSLRYRIKETEDVLTKLVRLVAHLAISERVGPAIARDDGILPLLDILERKSIETSEELVLNLVSCVTNLSYYHSEDNQILHVQKRFAKALSPLLLGPNEEAVVEAARSFGNFSRSPEVRAMMRRRRVDEMMVILLDHSNREIVFSVAGVLMNLAGDPAHRATLLDCGSLAKLTDAVAQYGHRDPEVTVVSLKTMYNLCLGAERCVFTGAPAADGLQPASLESARTILSACADSALAEVQRVKREARRRGDDPREGTLTELHDVCKTVLSALEAQAKLPPAEDGDPDDDVDNVGAAMGYGGEYDDDDDDDA